MSAGAPSRPRGPVVTMITIVCGLTVLGIGLLALLAPRSFATLINFAPYNEHLLHDVGAFELGIAVSLLAALIWSDAVAVALLGFLVGDVIHAGNHALDRRLGGHPGDLVLLGGLGVAAALALLLRLHQIRRSPALSDAASLPRKDTQ